MARKKHLQDISKEDMQLINEKLFKYKEVQTVEYVDSDIKKLRGFGYKLNVKCKTTKQKDFLNALKNDSKVICFGIGAAGTGKSFISLSYALSKLKDEAFDKIIMVIPTAQAVGRDMQTGFLPGDLNDKVGPFKDVDRYTIEKILKMSDNVDYKSYAKYLIDSGVIQYEFINFMLGKTFDNALILVNEAEQYTKEDMKLILTRIGENSKLIITGDCAQINRDSLVKGRDVCGLPIIADKLGDMEEVSITEFKKEDIVRNPIITKILDRL